MVAAFAVLAVCLELVFIRLCIAWGPVEQRRQRFWARVALACLITSGYMAGLAKIDALSGGSGSKLVITLVMLAVAVLLCLPALLYRRADPPPQPPNPGEGGGGGGGSDPRTPGRPPEDPRGGIPLPDAEPSGARLRDHRTSRPAVLRPRRPEHAPRRTRPRTPASPVRPHPGVSPRRT